MHEKIQRAQILIDALPYIRDFRGKTFVVKYGGNAMTDPELKKMVIQDFLLLHYVGIKLVVVHGGGPAISQTMNRMNIPFQFIDGQRVTDSEALAVTEMVLTGMVNKEIVSLLNLYGGKSVGLSGKDGLLIEAAKKKASADLGYVGEVACIHPHILEVMEENGFICVVSPIGIDKNGQSYNINADTVAAHIASALQAEKLFLLTNINGLMENVEDPSTLISSLSLSTAEKHINNKSIQGGMIPKIQACIQALRKGVKKAHMINGTIEHALLLETFTPEGIGTQIYNDLQREF